MSIFRHLSIFRFIDTCLYICFHGYHQKSLSFPHFRNMSFCKNSPNCPNQDYRNHTLPYRPTPPLLSYYVSLSRCAEQLLFSCLCSKITVYCRKLKCFFYIYIIMISTTHTFLCEFWVHGAGSQLKTCIVYPCNGLLLMYSMWL